MPRPWAVSATTSTTTNMATLLGVSFVIHQIG
jgi:hypothetical protein